MALFSVSPAFQRRARIAAWLWGLAIFVACLMPGEKIPKVDAPLADKWVHFALFGFLSVLQLLGARTHSPRILRNVLLFGLAYGIAIEGLQGITHQWLHRYFDTTDMIADGLGTVLGIGLFLLLFRRNTTAS